MHLCVCVSTITTLGQLIYLWRHLDVGHTSTTALLTARRLDAYYVASLSCTCTVTGLL